MTIANNLVAKLSVAFVTVAMFFTMVAPAQAQTAEELQQMINDLLAQIASLQGEVGGSSAAGVCPYTWTRTLNTGATGADVMKLQQFLNADADTRVAVTGAGSAGMETQYYGPATGAAVAKFQAKYRTDILSPLGLVNPTTFFGNSTMAKANALCASAPTTPTTPGTSTGALDGGEASLEDLQGSDGDDTNLEEGQEDAPVADFEFDVEDGDVEVNRIDVVFDGSGNGPTGEEDPWKVFETVSIWVDGEMIAEEDADAKSDWMDDSPRDDLHTMRFTALDWVVREGETAEFTVAVTVANSVDAAGTAADWEIFIAEDGIRAVDGLGIQNYLGEEDDTSPTEAVDFDIDEEGAEDELIVKSSSEDPSATTLQVEDDKKSDWLTVFAFDLDTDDSVSDITLDSLQVDVDATENGTAATSTEWLINDARLVVDGETYDDVAITHGTTGEFVFDLDDDLVIDAGDRVTVEFQVEFKALTAAFEGATVEATTDGADIDAEGADGITATGSSTGDEHTLRTGGISVEIDSKTSDVSVVEGATNDYATFTIDFEVTAFEQDVYIPTDVATATTWEVQNQSGTDLSGTGTSTPILDSTADVDGDYFVVNEGQTETFTLEVTYLPGVANQAARLQLLTVEYAADDVDPTDTWNATPLSDYRTPTKTIVN